MTVRVKICGLKDVKSLHAAIDAGANFVGFVDYPKSPRHIIPAEAAKLIALLPAQISSVIVTVNPDDVWIDQIDFYVSPTYVQLHGDESPERVHEIKTRLHEAKIIKAISVESAEDISKAAAYENCADMLLFDTKPRNSSPIRGEVRWGANKSPCPHPNPPATGEGIILPGGNGITFDWSLLQGKHLSLPWMLSGGLNAANIKAAISQTGAAMVDVSSGVETSPGVKDAALIKQFIEAAKNI